MSIQLNSFSIQEAFHVDLAQKFHIDPARSKKIFLSIQLKSVWSLERSSSRRCGSTRKTRGLSMIIPSFLDRDRHEMGWDRSERVTEKFDPEWPNQIPLRGGGFPFSLVVLFVISRSWLSSTRSWPNLGRGPNHVGFAPLSGFRSCQTRSRSWNLV